MTAMTSANQCAVRTVVLAALVLNYAYGTEQAASRFGDFPEEVVMKTLTGSGATVLPRPAAKDIVERTPELAPEMDAARQEAAFYVETLLRPELVPPDLDTRFMFGRVNPADSRVSEHDVLQLLYRVEDLAVRVHQTNASISVSVQRIGSERIVVDPPVSREEATKARDYDFRGWQGWRRPQHAEMEKLVLELAQKLFVREGQIPEKIEIARGPYPLGPAGMVMQLTGTGRSARDYRAQEFAGRLFSGVGDGFSAFTDGHTVTFHFFKWAGRPRARLPGDWFTPKPSLPTP